MLNRVLLMGRLTAEPELRTAQDGECSVISFSIAVERDYKNRKSGKRETDFFDITAWRGLAELVANYMHKGSQIVVDGKLENATWKDREGNTRKSLRVVADNIYFAREKKTDGEAPGESEEEVQDNCPDEGGEEDSEQ